MGEKFIFCYAKKNRHIHVIGSQNNITIAALITEVLRAFIEKYAKENQMNYNIAKNKIFKAIRETIDEEDISEGLS